LAGAVGASVPEIRLDQVEGKPGLHAISIAFGKESVDLLKVPQASGIGPELAAALKQGIKVTRISRLGVCLSWLT
jgi:hypothetical protein